jgi:poly(beta-D-mannuronate) lyase
MALPSSIIDLTNWYLTLPSGKDGHPDTIHQPQLKNYSDSNFKVDGSAVVFKGPCDGVTTINSHYPRSELRETKGSALAAWSLNDVSEMVWSGAVTHLPEHKPEVVIGQIHDAKDDVVMIKLAGKVLTFENNGKTIKTLDSNYELGKQYTLKLRVEKMVISVFYNDMSKSVGSWKGKNSKSVNYFKVGCYTQSNKLRGALPGEYAETKLFSVLVKH